MIRLRVEPSLRFCMIRRRVEHSLRFCMIRRKVEHSLRFCMIRRRVEPILRFCMIRRRVEPNLRLCMIQRRVEPSPLCRTEWKIEPTIFYFRIGVTVDCWIKAYLHMLRLGGGLKISFSFVYIYIFNSWNVYMYIYPFSGLGGGLNPAFSEALRRSQQTVSTLSETDVKVKCRKKVYIGCQAFFLNIEFTSCTFICLV